MSYGSILLMCFLMFVLGGQDRLPWAPMPVMLESASESAAPSATAKPSPEVRVSGFGDVDPPQPEGRAGAPSAPPPKKANRPASVGGGVVCAAGFPLSLPPEAPETYAALDWMAEEGRAATIRYAFANGGLLEFAQIVLDPERGAPGLTQLASMTLPLPKVAQALPAPTFDIAWQDDRRRYVVRSFGLSETETLAWIRSLGTPGTTCTPSTS
jgi:hypothetical protein